MNLAVNGKATKSDLANVKNALNSIDTIDHEINGQDLLELQEKFNKFYTPSQVNYTINFYRAYGTDTTALPYAIVSLIQELEKKTKRFALFNQCF